MDTDLATSSPTTGAGSAPPRVSVLMPVYNAERYLREAIESILAQTFTDFEFIIVDDGSTDGTADILQEYASRDERVQIVSQANRGLTRSLNTSIRLARGELIARMDADDVAIRDRFEQQVRYLEQHPCTTALGGQVLLIDDEGLPIGPEYLPTDHESLVRRLWNGQYPIAHPTAMIRASAMRQVNGYSEEFRVSQDFDLWFRISEIGFLANLDSTLLKYRQHRFSTCTLRAAEQRTNTAKAIAAARSRLGLPQMESEDSPNHDASLHISAVYASWATLAARSGHRRAARKYAWRGLCSGFLRKDTWYMFGDVFLPRATALAARCWRARQGTQPAIK